MPDVLYYNCDDPVSVLREGKVRASTIFTGVSFSEWSELGSHGPFKIAFRSAPWFANCTRVVYWDIAPRYDQALNRILNPSYFAENQDGEQIDRVEYDIRQAAYERHASFSRIWRTSAMFRDEREWFSPESIDFASDDVISTTYMINAPCCISSRKLKTARLILQKVPGYSERVVDDFHLNSNWRSN